MTPLGFDLILLGAPAAGKDTQALILQKNLKLKPVESGKYWRKMASQNNAQGKLLRSTFSKGKLAPVRLMKGFITDNLKNIPHDSNLVFIGNPRLKPEAQLLVKLLRQKRRDFFAIFLSLPDREIKKRSKKRHRDIQDTEYIQTRIRLNRELVSKTVEYFKGLNKIKVINGNQSITAVAKDVRKAINDYQKSRRDNNS